jgi:hypothetical protein
MKASTVIRVLPCVAVVCVLSHPGPLCAQALYGSLVGNVNDASGAAIAGARVTLTSIDTKQSREVVTNDVGGYDFSTLPPGAYELKVQKEGFSSSTQTGIAVVANNTVRVDVTLNIGAVTESITVSGAAATLQTDRSEVRHELNSNQLVNLPVSAGRNYQTLFVTLPGFGGIQASYNSTPSNPSKALVFNVNGASFSINNTRIDGVQSINPWLPHETAYVPTLEAIDQVNVVTNSFEAETGMAGGAAIYVQTKSGGNDFHGAAFEEHNNQRLNSRPFFLPPSQSKPKYILNDFGGALGGPIVREKLFFFGSYEGTLDRELAALFTTVPTAAIKSGNMQGQNNPIYDPATGTATGANRTPFPDQIVPASRIDPIAAKLASLTPLPNLPGNLLTSNYYATGSYIFDRHRADAKVNWNATPKLSTFARFGFLHYNMINPTAFGDLGGPNISSAGGNPGHGYGNTYTLTLAGAYLLSPSFIIDAYWGWSRMGTNVVTPGLNEKRGLALGIPGTNGPALYQGGYPRFAVSGYDDLGTPGAFLPYFRHDPSITYVTNFNSIKGPHDIRFGAEINQLSMNHIQAEGGYGAGMGGFLFAGGPTSIAGGPSPNQFNSYATFLLGLPTSVGKNTIVPNELTTRSWSYGLYIRDRWNASPKLTLSYGLRWEYYPLPSRDGRGIGLYDPATNNVRICGYGSVPDNCGISISKHQFAPRVGIAYRPTTTLVLRAGYGITIDPYSLGRPFKYNYPDLLIQTYDGPNSYQPFGTLEQGIPAAVIPDLGNGLVPLPNQYVTTTINQQSFKRGYIQSWNFTVQKELPANLVAQAGYVATRSTDQLGYLDLNAGQVPGLGIAGQPLYQKFGRTAATTYITPMGTDQYNSLQAKLDRRFAQGVQLGANYTWSKSIGPAANDDTAPRVSALQYFYLNRAVLPYDRTHVLNLTGTWELPFGKGKPWLSHGIGSALAGNWRINGIASFMSGLPFSVSASGASLNMPGNTQRADQVKPKVQILGGVGPGQSYFDPFAFAPVTQPRFGNAGYYSMRGPGAVNTDLAIGRDFPIKERFHLQFRAEAFNASNTPHFALPGANVSNLVLNGDGTVRNLAGYTQILSTQNLGRDFDERHIQFDLRFSF